MVAELTDGLLLYHGSYCEVKQVDLNQCRKYKDFGQGFYLTTSKAQAEQFALISTRKSIQAGLTASFQGYGFVSRFSFHNNDSLQKKVFPNADVEWLHCIVGHRRPNFFHDEIRKLKEFDIIGGKIADDDTNATILAYIAGTFGMPGSTRAEEICISLLLPDRLKDQYCFRTQKALDFLEWRGTERVWMNR